MTKIDKKISNTQAVVRLTKNRTFIVLVFCVAVAAIGALLLARSNAATFVAAIEAEAGVQTTRAIKTSDAGASGGVAVKFAAGGTPIGTVKLMPLGDSITLGSDGGYRTLLWQKMVQTDKKNVDFVGSLTDGPSSLGDRNHEGHSGWTIDQIRGGIDGWMSTYKPNLVLLHIGTNDMRGDGGASTEPTRLKDLVSRICSGSPGVEVIVASIVPFAGRDSRVDAYNAQIPGVVNSVKSASCKATFFDMHAYLTTADLADGIHPTVPGYNKMANAWYPVATAAYDRLVSGN